MLAFPTPTFDAKNILQAPGYRPTGRGSHLVYEVQPEASTPMNLVNRTTKNGLVGSRSKNFTQAPYREPGFDPTKGTPLSKPGSVGNVSDQAISVKPKYAEPENGELKAIMNVLNGKPNIDEDKGKLSARQVVSLGKKSKKLTQFSAAVKVVKDYTDTKEQFRKSAMVKKAISQGFSVAEANAAYEKVRIKEAEAALMKEQDPSNRLYDLIDSKLGGTQDGTIRSNDETGLFLAKGGNVVALKEAEARNASIESKITRGDGRKNKLLPAGMAL